MGFSGYFNLAKVDMFEDTKVENFRHNRSKFPLTLKLRPEGKITVQKSMVQHLGLKFVGGFR